MGNTNTNRKASAKRNTKRNQNIMGSRTAAVSQPGADLPAARGGAVRLTLPKGSYTIDGDGNLSIHGCGAMSDGATAGLPGLAGLSYGEFMEKAGGRGEGCGMDSREDPFGMDFSAFGVDPEKMVRECAGTVYGYARVSTDHQDYQRQIDALLKLGIREEDIFKDKKSGKDFNREEFRKLMHALRPGDCIVVVELDRFGRSMREIRNHWFWITQQKQADIVVLDQPVLNTRPGAHGLGSFLADLTLAVFSLMAEIERNLINRRMEAGIRRARLAGRKLGRKLMEIPLLFWKIKEEFLGGLISQNMASQELGVDPKTFRSWMERTGGVSDAQEWEALKAGIEEREREERIRQAKIEYGEMAGSAGVEVGQRVNAGFAGRKTGREANAGRVGAEAGQKVSAGRVGRKAGEEADVGCTDAEVGQEAKARCAGAKAKQQGKARGVGAAAGQGMPAGSGRADADGGPRRMRKTMEKSLEAAGRVGHGAAGNPARADGGVVEKGRWNHRTSKCQKLPDEVKKKPDPGRKPHPKNRRI